MAKIGLRYPVYKGAVSGVIAKAIQADIAIEVNDAVLYADDGIAETDKTFRRGTITLGIDDLSDTVQSDLLGHAVNGGEVTAHADDEPGYVGFGFVAVKKVNGARKYRGLWFPKVQFSEPSDNNATQAESLAFATPSLSGLILRDDNGNWKQEQTFATEADAKAYIEVLAGIPVSASGGLSGLAMTGTGGTLSPAFGAGVRFYTYGGVTGTSVTVTATAAGHIIKLLVDGAYNQTLTSGAASASIPVAAGSKKLTIIAQEPGKQSQTTEIVVVKTA